MIQFDLPNGRSTPIDARLRLIYSALVRTGIDGLGVYIGWHERYDFIYSADGGRLWPTESWIQMQAANGLFIQVLRSFGAEAAAGGIVRRKHNDLKDDLADEVARLQKEHEAASPQGEPSVGERPVDAGEGAAS